MALLLGFVIFGLKEPALVEDAERAGEKALGFATALMGRLSEFFRELGRGFFLSGPGPIVGVIVAILPVGAVALGLAFQSTMPVDLGMQETEIASLTLAINIVNALTCIAGGWLADRFGHRRALAVFVILTAIPTFMLAQEFTGAKMEGLTVSEFWRWMLLFQAANGLTSAASIAIYMGFTSPKVAGTQFTGYMAMKNLVYTYSSNWQGRMAESQGYATPLRLDALIALLPLVFYPWLRPSRRSKPVPKIE
jgi:predicted MFS family arabinose efflux permease